MELHELTDKAINYIIDQLCDELALDAPDNRPKLTKWERDFVISIEEQWNKKHFLSDKQKMTLGNIWDKF
jgi:hypothetical protein